MADIKINPPVSLNDLTRRTSLKLFLNSIRKRIIKGPAGSNLDQRRRAREQIEFWQARIKPLMTNGRQLWWWQNPKYEGEPVSSAVGVAVVEEDRIIDAWVLAHTL